MLSSKSLSIFSDAYSILPDAYSNLPVAWSVSVAHWAVKAEFNALSTTPNFKLWTQVNASTLYNSSLFQRE
jgi:hypothetical protein